MLRCSVSSVYQDTRCRQCAAWTSVRSTQQEPDDAKEHVPERSLPRLRRAAGARIRGSVSASDAVFAARRDVADVLHAFTGSSPTNILSTILHHSVLLSSDIPKTLLIATCRIHAARSTSCAAANSLTLSSQNLAGDKWYLGSGFSSYSVELRRERQDARREQRRGHCRLRVRMSGP